jgi:hypothetical protein
MMDFPLLLRTFLLRSAKYFPKKEIVSVFPECVHRYTYRIIIKGCVSSRTR